jgi:hypothetical protein
VVLAHLDKEILVVLVAQQLRLLLMVEAVEEVLVP